MHIDEIKALVNRRPFRPFIVNIIDGEQLPIAADSEVLFPRSKPDLFIVFNADGSIHLLESGAVASLQTI